MTSQYVWAGMVVGVFLAGLGVGYAIFSNTYIQPYAMMQNPQLFNSMMLNNPQFMNVWMNNMVQNPQFMNQWMSTMMQNSQFQQQYMGTWIMFQNQRFMHGIMNQWTIPPTSTGGYIYPIVKTDQVSIVSGAWQINTTESYSPTIIQVITGTTVTWTNNDNVVHTVTNLNGTFDSHLILPSTSWKYTFFNEGKYNYFCTLHPWMKGLVIVS